MSKDPSNDKTDSGEQQDRAHGMLAEIALGALFPFLSALAAAREGAAGFAADVFVSVADGLDGSSNGTDHAGGATRGGL
ncbi:MAG TPA: hypothetical protein VLI90_00300 [Tepidisphaeraceae bacterium]|nr:hypothetical protein [Tepidisphaeraceae bacterium]